MILISAEPLLSTLSTTILSDISPEKTYFLQAFEEDESSGENSEKIIIRKSGNYSFVTEEVKNMEVQRKNQKGNKVEEQRIRKCKEPNT
jgi:hypothetical protein